MYNSADSHKPGSRKRANKSTEVGKVEPERRDQELENFEPINRPEPGYTLLASATAAGANSVNESHDDPESSPDPDDLDALWAPTQFASAKRKRLNVRAAPRPPKDKFIQVLQFEMGGDNLSAYVNCRPVHLFEYAADEDSTPDTFYVLPGTDAFRRLADEGRLKPAILVIGKVLKGETFVWELKLPDGRNKSADKWAESRLQIAKLATTKWIKPCANMAGGGFDYIEPEAVYDSVDWSREDTFEQLVQIACRDRIVKTLDHVAVKEALGL